MSEEIKAALTPEEWREVLESDYPPIDHIAYESPQDPYKAAALCLYGQQFGFTREDVRRLRHLIDMHDFYSHDEESQAHAYSVVDRLAALLPPEEIKP